MDKKIAKKTWTLKRISTYGGIALVVLLVGYQFIFADRRSTLKVDKSKITISTVQRGEFKEYIPQTGTVEPSRTVYLDAIEAGNVKKIIRESGAMVKVGDVIMELTNLNRELAVLQQEAQLIESINRSRDTRLGITKNDLEQRSTLALIDNQLAVIGPQYRRQKQMFEKKLISIHPFVDGNGRTIRLMRDLIYTQFNLPPPYLVSENELFMTESELIESTLVGMRLHLEAFNKGRGKK